MIRVELADEPLDFDAKVRQPGLRAIAELAGEPGLPKRKGRPRKAIANSREQIPADKFPSYWTESLPELRTAYGHICSYVCVYIEPVTGAALAQAGGGPLMGRKGGPARPRWVRNSETHDFDRRHPGFLPGPFCEGRPCAGAVCAAGAAE